MKTAEGVYNIPIRRSIWQSFFIGVAAIVLSGIVAAELAGLLMWITPTRPAQPPERAPVEALTKRPPRHADYGALVVLGLGLVLFGGYFGSIRWQRRLSRSLDSRRPGIRIADGVMAVPVGAGRVLQINLSQPYSLNFGWNTGRLFGTRAIISQGDKAVLLEAPQE